MARLLHRQGLDPGALLDRAGLGVTLLLPVFLLHGRGLAEACVGLIGASFLARSALARDWSWLARPWLLAGLAWWAWLMLCTALAGGDRLGQAAGVPRFFLLVAALEHWTLRDAQARLWLLRVLQAAALYIAAQCALQLAAGVNLFGHARGADGELTGPYQNPRAGPPFARLLFPTLLPPVHALLSQPGWRPLGGVVLAAAGVGVVVLIGQRMPLLLTLGGLFVVALLLPRLRGAVMVSLIAVSMLLTATSVLSPPTFNRLVTKFSAQMQNFPESHYGQIAARGWAIVQAHPATGRGFDGFRDQCANPAYFQGWQPGTDGGGAGICVPHAHSHYLQALVEGGAPGLLLFCALVWCWLREVGRGLWHAPTPLRAGLFAAVLVHEWPIASTGAFTAMPLSGWFFVVLGLGLAEARAYMNTTKPRSRPCPT